MSENEQIGGVDRWDRLRQEIDGKLERLDGKIEKKLPYNVFFWAMGSVGVLTTIALAIFLAAFGQIGKSNDKIDDMSRKTLKAMTRAGEVIKAQGPDGRPVYSLPD